MTKTLTEQFMNNELDDRLYYFTQKMSPDKAEIGHSFELNMVRADDGEYLDWFLIHEVLAPVPSYDEYKQYEKCADMLIDVNKKWEQTIKANKMYGRKLDIAIRALQDIAFEIGDLESDYGYHYELAKKALKEMEGVK